MYTRHHLLCRTLPFRMDSKKTTLRLTVFAFSKPSRFGFFPDRLHRVNNIIKAVKWTRVMYATVRMQRIRLQGFKKTIIVIKAVRLRACTFNYIQSCLRKKIVRYTTLFSNIRVPAIYYVISYYSVLTSEGPRICV